MIAWHYVERQSKALEFGFCKGIAIRTAIITDITRHKHGVKRTQCSFHIE
jgi:hypothetical protein